MRPDRYDESVFINCPFDNEYRPLFEAIVFAVSDCGFRARCALEIDDSGQVRIEKIMRLIGECRLGIHDISRTELDRDTGLPRFNMPLELGIFLGATRFGNKTQREKCCLVLDREPFRFQKFLSDIAGQDPKSHGGHYRQAIVVVRDWLRNNLTAPGVIIPGGEKIAERYELFRVALPLLRNRLDFDAGGLVFKDLTMLVAGWIEENPRPEISAGPLGAVGRPKL